MADSKYSGELTAPEKASYFPSTFIDPKLKSEKKYCIGVTKAIYSQSWSSYGNPYSNIERGKMIDTRSFVNGQFNVQAFMGGVKDPNDKDKNPFLKNLDFDPVTEMPKIQDIVVGFMEQNKYKITATAINPAAQAQRENARLNDLAAIKLKPYGEKINQAAGRPIMPEPKMPFKTEDELNLYFQLGGFKLIAEMAIEVGNKIVNNDSDWTAIKKGISEDAFACGRIIVDTEIDSSNRLRYVRVDPVNCGVEDYFGHYLAKPSKVWYSTVMTVQDIILDAANSGTPFTTEEAKNLAKTYENRYSNPSWSSSEQGAAQQYVNTDSSMGMFWYQWKIPVMKSYWEELDVYKTATVTKGGKQMTMPTSYEDKSREYYNTGTGRPEPRKLQDGSTEPYNPEIHAAIVKREVEEIYIHNYYTSKWIPGTDYIWAYGKVPFQARDPYNYKRALCPLKYYRITLTPLGERIKGLVKKEYMAWLKLDREVAKAVPWGWQINISALENISLGQNKTFTVQNAIEVMNMQGDLLYRDEAVADEFGRTKGKIPLIPIDQRGCLEAMQRWMELINFYKMRIVDLTGINDYMDASNPNVNASATLAKAAIAGSKNSMSQLTSAVMSIQEKLALDTSARLQLIIQKYGAYNGYADSFGTGMMQAMSVGDECLSYTYGIAVAGAPSEEGKQEMKTAVYQAFAGASSPNEGSPYIADVLEFNSMIDADVDFKVIRLMMQARQKQNMEAVQQQNVQNIQATAKANQENMAQASEAKLKEMQAEAQIKIAYEREFTVEVIKRNQSLVNEKTTQTIITSGHKSELKKGEEILKSTLEK